MMKRNEGFTLVELIVAIAISTMVVAAASALLILGLRISTRSSKLAVQQNVTHMVLNVMGDIIAEEADQVTEGSPWTVKNNSDEEIVSYKNSAIYLRGTELLKNVETSTADLEGNLLTITIDLSEGPSYTTSVYCRLLEQPGEQAVSEGEASIQTAYAQRNYREVLTFAVESRENPENVTEFLSVLASQYGSRGQILDEAGQGTGEYFSQWYIGSYEENPDWNKDTPWCACYLSWAMARCEGLAETPRFANVDTFWSEFVTEQNWTSSNPVPGDIVFFDWIVDDEYNPQHVGAVIAVADGWVYTIEGNSGGRVAVCRYDREDPCILGYGQLKWK